MNQPASGLPADVFDWCEDPGPDTTARVDAFARMGARMRLYKGVKSLRMTITPVSCPFYPAGLWVEGWLDADCVKLPFGAAAVPGGPTFPPRELARISEGVAA